MKERELKKKQEKEQHEQMMRMLNGDEYEKERLYNSIKKSMASQSNGSDECFSPVLDLLHLKKKNLKVLENPQMGDDYLSGDNSEESIRVLTDQSDHYSPFEAKRKSPTRNRHFTERSYEGADQLQFTNKSVMTNQRNHKNISQDQKFLQLKNMNLVNNQISLAYKEGSSTLDPNNQRNQIPQNSWENTPGKNYSNMMKVLESNTIDIMHTERNTKLKHIEQKLVIIQGTDEHLKEKQTGKPIKVSQRKLNQFNIILDPSREVHFRTDAENNPTSEHSSKKKDFVKRSQS